MSDHLPFTVYFIVRNYISCLFYRQPVQHNCKPHLGNFYSQDNTWQSILSAFFIYWYLVHQFPCTRRSHSKSQKYLYHVFLVWRNQCTGYHSIKKKVDNMLATIFGLQAVMLNQTCFGWPPHFHGHFLLTTWVSVQSKVYCATNKNEAKQTKFRLKNKALL